MSPRIGIIDICFRFGTLTWPDGDSYVGAWEGGVRQGWGAYYWNNGNSYQVRAAFQFSFFLRVVANVMEGQALHFRWGDGAKFQCAELKDCFRQGSIGR